MQIGCLCVGSKLRVSLGLIGMSSGRHNYNERRSVGAVVSKGGRNIDNL